MEFKTSLDAAAKAMTGMAFGLFGLLFALYQVYSFWFYSPREMVDLLAVALQIGFGAALLLSTYSYSPLGYRSATAPW